MNKYICNDCGTNFIGTKYNLVCQACNSTNIDLEKSDASARTGLFLHLTKFIKKYKWYVGVLFIIFIVKICTPPPPKQVNEINFEGSFYNNNIFKTSFFNCEGEIISKAINLKIINVDKKGQKYGLKMQKGGIYYPILDGQLEITKPANIITCVNYFKTIHSIDKNFELNEFNEKYHIEIPYDNGEIKTQGCNSSDYFLIPKSKYSNPKFQFSFDQKNWNEKPPFKKENIFGESKKDKKIYIRNKEMKSEVVDLNIEYTNSDDKYNYSSSFQKIEQILSKDNIDFKDKLELSNLANEIEKEGGIIEPSMTEIIMGLNDDQKYVFKVINCKLTIITI